MECAGAALKSSRSARQKVADELPDAELVADALGGSGEAFVVLYQRHVRAVHCALSDTVHDAERRRDLVQETFTRALAKLATLREASQFRPWVLQIARNAGIDDLRSRSQFRLEPIDDDSWLPASDHDRPGVMAEFRAVAGAVRDGMAALSARDAAVVSMVAQLGFGPTEVAAALDVSYGNAKVVLHRARARLREALALHDV